MILAIDIETTGLDPTRDRILELAYVLLDDELQELQRDSWVIYCPMWGSLADDYVRNMHAQSGLSHLVRTASYSTVDVEAALLRIVADHKPVLLGSSVHFDRGFLRHWMPLLESKLSHRHTDASTLLLTFPHVLWPEHKGTKHRALDDVLHSIEIVRHARKALYLYDGSHARNLLCQAMAQLDGFTEDAASEVEDRIAKADLLMRGEGS